MSKKSCKIPIIIKSRFVSAFIASCGILMGMAFIYPVANFSVYLTSYIHLKDSYVTMHYGLFLNLIFAFSTTFGMSIGGLLEHKIGFISTTLTGLCVILVGDIFFIRIQNIWLCYALTFIMGTGSGIANSLTGKNLALFKPKIKALLISIMAAFAVIFSGVFATLGEKIISPKGYTLSQGEEFYPANICKRTYLYFLSGFIVLPFAAVIFLLFIVEYKKEYSKDSIVVEERINEENEEKEKVEESEEKENINLKNERKGENNIKEDEDIIDFEIKSMSKKKSIKKVFKTFRFWRLAFIQLFITFSFSFILGTGRTFGALIGINGTSLQYLMLLQSGALILIGPILGFISDKKGPLPLVRISAVICMIPGILLTFFTDKTPIFISSFVISILGLICGLIGFAPYMMEIYGIQESVIIGGAINVFAKISEIISTVSAFVISQLYTKDEIIKPYKIMYLSGAICCGISFVLLLFENDKKFVYDEDKENLGAIVENKRISTADN